MTVSKEHRLRLLPILCFNMKVSIVEVRGTGQEGNKSKCFRSRSVEHQVRGYRLTFPASGFVGARSLQIPKGTLLDSLKNVKSSPEVSSPWLFRRIIWPQIIWLPTSSICLALKNVQPRYGSLPSPRLPRCPSFCSHLVFLDLGLLCRCGHTERFPFS